jgi:hypothetical protein
MFAHQVLVGCLFLVCQAFDFLPPAPTRPSRAPTEPWTNQSTALEVSTGAQGNVGDVDASETILRRDGSAIADSLGANGSFTDVARRWRKGARVICRRKKPRRLLEVAILVLGTVLSPLAQAQQTAPIQPGSNLTPQDLAKSVHNPFEDFVKVPLQSTTGLASGRITTQEKTSTFSH